MFSFTRKKADAAQARSFMNATPLSLEDVRKLTKWAGIVCTTLRESIPGFDYNAASLKILSEIVTKERLRYSQERTVQLANMYGAFFGHVLILRHRELGGTWVRSEDGIGLRLGSDERKHIVYPITRVFKHIEQGEEFSLYSLYAAVCSIFDIEIPKTVAPPLRQAAPPAPGADADAADAEMAAVIAEVRAEFETRRKVLNERTFASIQVPNPAWLPASDALADTGRQQLFLHREGRIVWGAVLQANTLLFSPGADDCPAGLLHSIDPWFDGRPRQLQAIAAKAGAAIETPFGLEEMQFAELFRDDRRRTMNCRLPASVTQKDVRTTSCLLYRKHIPNGVLAARCFPLLVHPSTPIVMMLPFEFWPLSLIMMWKQGRLA